jgi:hypothetical protein
MATFPVEAAEAAGHARLPRWTLAMIMIAACDEAVEPSSFSETTDNGPTAVACAAAHPGDPCDQDNEVCTLVSADGCDVCEGACTGGQWVAGDDCSHVDDGSWECCGQWGELCPVPCPSEVPVAGASCRPTDPPRCFYDLENACSSGELAVVTCELGAGWTVVSPCGGCSSEADCMADPTCRWLVPAGERSSFAIGCYPAGDCGASSCEAPLSCRPVEACATAECGSSVAAALCLPG